VARLYADENFPLQVVVALRRLGHDVLTVLEAGQANQRIEDVDILAFAVTAGRALLTINRRDFIRLHRQQPAHRGIVVCTEDADTEGQAQRIHVAIDAVSSLDGMLIRIKQSLATPCMFSITAFSTTSSYQRRANVRGASGLLSPSSSSAWP
jgi:predicted nuclease of predicted toxin-antitoxin system